MTKGWKLCVKWKDGTTSWERLADLNMVCIWTRVWCRRRQTSYYHPVIVWPQKFWCIF
jgi:hypothetical protein